MNILFIGGGNIVSAIVNGLKISDENLAIYVKGRSDERSIELAKKLDISPYISGASAHFDMIFIGVKPADVRDALNDIKNIPTKSVVSLAAGITLKSMREDLGSKETLIVRAMPNTSTNYGCGITVISSEATNEDALLNVVNLLKLIGKVLIVEEDKQNIGVALFGSGPAFIYRIAESLEKIAISEGIAKTQAKEMVSQLILGSGVMLTKSEKNISELRENVTSPKGTTAAGLDVINDSALDSILRNAIDAAKTRSIELGSKKL